MTSTLATRKSTKPRSLRFYPGSPALVEMQIGRDSFAYWIKPIVVDFGAAYEVRKLLADGGDVYHCHTETHRFSCDCRGHVRHGHCKHSDSIHALIAAGKLDRPNTSPTFTDADFDNP
jgi:hypothetical protein